MKLICVLLFLLLFGQGYAGEQLYLKEVEGYTVRMDFTPYPEEGRTTWEVSLMDKVSSRTILLDCLEIDCYWAEEDYPFVGDLRKCVLIGDALVYDNAVYIMYCKLDTIISGDCVCFVKYGLQKEGVVKKEYFLEEIFRPSYANYGDPGIHSTIKQISPEQLAVVWNMHRIGTYNLKKEIFTRYEVELFSETHLQKNELPENRQDSMGFIEKDIQRVLGKNISLMGFIEDEQAVKHRNTLGFIYFFYTSPGSKELRLLPYRNYKKLWGTESCKKHEIHSGNIHEYQEQYLLE